MNDLLVTLSLEDFKPLISALLLPPVPMLLMAALGLRWTRQKRRIGPAVVLCALAALWAVSTAALGQWLVDTLTRTPPALDAPQIARLAAMPHTAILVLGAGRRAMAPEYGEADLKPLALERLRYGVWLARRTGLPLGYSGGLGYGAAPGPTEAEVAARVAERDFGVTLRWQEDRSRDTHENALRSVSLLHGAGIEHIVLVTHDFHQQRALADFGRAIRREAASMTVIAAPLGLHRSAALQLADLLPSVDGFSLSYWALHEWLGWLAGA